MDSHRRARSDLVHPSHNPIQRPSMPRGSPTSKASWLDHSEAKALRLGVGRATAIRSVRGRVSQLVPCVKATKPHGRGIAVPHGFGANATTCAPDAWKHLASQARQCAVDFEIRASTRRFETETS